MEADSDGMFALLFLAETIAQKPDSGPASATAQAVVRVERGTTVRAEDWHKPKDGQRREVRRTGEDGRPLLLRLVEHE